MPRRSAAGTIWSGAGSTTWVSPDTVSTRSSETRPVGPFRADAAAYRLCGNSTRWVALWARFCRTDTDLLVNGYMYSGYTYETGETWLPPLKRAVVDAGGHLRLGYWKGNDALQGTPLNVDLGKFRKVHPGGIASGLFLQTPGGKPPRTPGPAGARFLRPKRHPNHGCRLGQHSRLQPGRRPDRDDSGDLPKSPAGGFIRRTLPGREARRRAPRSCCTATAERRSAS